MQISFSIPSLARATAIATRTVAKKPLTVGQDYIFFVVESGELWLKTFDSNSQTLIRVPDVKVDETINTVFATPCDFNDIVSRFTKYSNLELLVDENRASGNIDSGSSKFEIPLLSREIVQQFVFLEVSEEDEAKSISVEMSGSDLYKAFEGTAFAASDDPGKQIFQNVSFSYKQGKLTLNSTDSYRFAKVVSVSEEDQTTLNFLFQKSTLGLFISALKAYPYECVCSQKDNLFELTLNGGDLKIITRSGGNFSNYPPVEQIWPKNEALVHKAFCNRKQLLESLNRLTIMVKDDITSKVSLKISHNQGNYHLLISTPKQDKGFMQEAISCQATRELEKVNINSKFLSQHLSVLSSDNVGLFIDEQMLRLVLRTSDINSNGLNQETVEVDSSEKVSFSSQHLIALMRSL